MSMASEVYEMNLEEENERLKAELAEAKPKRLYIWDDNTGSYILYDKQQAQIDELVRHLESARNLEDSLRWLIRNNQLIAKHKAESIRG